MRLMTIALLLAASPQDKGDLVGHWKFNDAKDSTTAADSSPYANHANLKDGPKWVEGKSGGALEFDGKAAHVEIPHSESTKGLHEGNYTISAWFKAADAPPGQEDANNAHYAVVIKTGWHEGLAYSNEKKFIHTHWLAGEKPEEPKWTGAGTWEEGFDPGAWHHVVGVVDRKAGEVRLYVNGEHKSTSESFEANAKARDFGEATWKIGIASPGSEKWAWQAKATIDDVRLYKKALSADEAAALFKEGAK
jgi:hypothetical protein